MLAIPDDDPAGVASAISIQESGTVAQIKVGVDIAHTYRGDLRVALTSPSGREAVLHAQLGGPADDLVETFDSVSPGMLASMLGQPMKGTWLLRVSDRVGQDVGTLKAWRIELSSLPQGASQAARAAAGGLGLR